jgi:adenylate cyclase, class 2
MAQHRQETEIKLRVSGAAASRILLRAAGFRVWKRRVFESNTILDTPGRSLRADSCLLRIRRAGKTSTLTFKGPPITAKHKSREEREMQIDQPDEMSAILERLGFAPVFRYEKYRTEFKRPGNSGIATVDETPIGVFMELEGSPTWIDRTARRLGFHENDYITASYGRLYLEWCAGRGVEPAHMVF